MQVQISTRHLQRQRLALSVNSDTSVWVLNLCASGNEPPCLWEMVWYKDNKKTELVPGAWGGGQQAIFQEQLTCTIPPSGPQEARAI